MDTRTGEIILAGGNRSGMSSRYMLPMEVSPTSAQMKARKVGRNDPCPCNSGKKFKHCHLGKEVQP